MKIRSISLLTVLFAIILSSCTAATQQKAPPTPASGKANVTGRIISINTGEPYSDATVRLAEVYRNELGEGAYALDAALSPQTNTDDQGYFIFTDVDAREYVLLIGDPMTRYLIITDDSGKTQVFDCPADKVTDLGEFRIDYDA